MNALQNCPKCILSHCRVMTATQCIPDCLVIWLRNTITCEKNAMLRSEPTTRMAKKSYIEQSADEGLIDHATARGLALAMSENPARNPTPAEIRALRESLGLS